MIGFNAHKRHPEATPRHPEATPRHPEAEGRRISFYLAIALLLTIATPAFSAEKARPFRLGVFRMNKSYDAVKPLAVVDSSGYVIKGDVIVGGYDSKFLTAWNFKLNKRLWWSAIDGEPTSNILTVENTAFVATRSGKIYAINLTTGQQVWEVALDAHCERPLLFSSGKIYALSVGQVAYSIDAATGKRLWVYDAGFPDNLTIKRPPAPIIVDDKIVFGISSGELIALKQDDGKLAWRYNPLYVDHKFHDFVGEMTLSSGKLLVTRYDGLVALIDLGSTRQVIWQTINASISTSSSRSGKVYVGLVGGDVIAYDLATGRLIWRAATGVASSFIIPGETNIYVVGNDGRIVAIDISNGEMLWGEDLGSRIASAPVVTEDKMYISTGLRNIYGYKL